MTGVYLSETIEKTNHMHKPSGFRDYFIASLLAATVVVFFSLYLVTRRGYFFDAPVTADPLFVPNKALACAGMTLLTLTFLIGPLSRYFDRWDYLLAYRKEIGIVGGFLALFHAFVSYFLLPLKFPQAKYNLDNPYTLAGLIGIFLLVFLFILSLKHVIPLMEGRTWWFWQRWGLRFVIVATLLHVYMMKWDGWIKWLTQGGGKATPELANPWMPGLGILATLFITWVVLIRLYESLFLFRDFGFTPKEISMNPVLRIHGRRFFIISFLLLIVAYVLVITRWIGV